MFLGRYSLTRDRHASFAMLVISESRPAAEVQQRGLGLDTRGQWLDPLSRGECWAGREKALYSVPWTYLKKRAKETERELCISNLVFVYKLECFLSGACQV